MFVEKSYLDRHNLKIIMIIIIISQTKKLMSIDNLKAKMKFKLWFTILFVQMI